MRCGSFGARISCSVLKCYGYVALILVFTAGFGVRGADIPICTARSDQHSPAVAGNGSNYLAVWEDSRNSGRDVYGQLVSHDGVLIDTNLPISVGPRPQRFPEVAWGDSSYLVVWDESEGDFRYVCGQRISANGTLLDTNFVITATGLGGVVDWDGRNFLVVWSSREDAHLYGRFVSSGGAMGEVFQISATDGYQTSRGIAWGGIGYLVVWRNDYNYDEDIYGQLISSEGSLIGDPFVIASAIGMRWRPNVAAGRSSYLVVWQDDRTGPWHIFGQLVTLDGLLMGSNFRITALGVEQWNSKVGGGGENFLVVWTDSRGYLYDVWGQEISESGGFIGSDFHVSSCTAETLYQDEAALCWGEDSYLVVWMDWRQGSDLNVYGAFVSSTEVEDAAQYPQNQLSLLCHPNPFTSIATIEYQLNTPAAVLLMVYNGLGEEIKTLVEGGQRAGRHSALWDAKDDQGRKVPSGLYFLRMEAGEYTATRKLCVVR